MTINQLIKTLEELQEEHPPDIEVTLPVYGCSRTIYYSSLKVHTTIDPSTKELVVCVLNRHTILPKSQIIYPIH